MERHLLIPRLLELGCGNAPQILLHGSEKVLAHTETSACAYTPATLPGNSVLHDDPRGSNAATAAEEGQRQVAENNQRGQHLAAKKAPNLQPKPVCVGGNATHESQARRVVLQ